ncbi:2-oxoglutarate dehydrogenase, E2 component, dihydrolipoamide succinyltransferase [Dermabacter hominis]|uniref:2-oxoglutarate dehydrogenase, E2 component, dihydrolipoamide succinyltransferase n=1 Tax=Dermabacter hominis TaxID=36740 RepID=UPI0021A5301C|nr:2-oxoglutarate dehydrogenase, E2 component, dihydrolipoamide succinyltransferase [Dermabacter hominis]MCT2055513.1 2-oxoglutarate dehydrogenase, E2 component, dihydrolipoamide succinyltransferase [Dermabacter hominis]MCT2083005.1 2-oxoglutarate dehydrogenase, E2 component, dihydrolipoamide succinyltransferase [Dermabacter hominis]MCT2091123.1 2-oxoglutarate dehydrogenase, E2 component, dihydrolipoamide succinyltransferase [Dermabacter hominis]MCT2189984.1 2-oxoglutarate dehydrogenase, E2 com
MSEIVKMPALGESVTEGTVVRWLKEVGEEIAVDEPLLEVSTDKVDTEVPSPVAGVLEKILVNEDEDAEVGADLAVVGDGSGTEAPSEGDNLASDQTVAPSTAEETPAGESERPAEAAKASDAADGQEITMPALGESVDSGTVVRWLKEVGDEVEADEPLLEVSTDKVDTEVPSPIAGTLQKILVQEDEEAEVGAAIAVIGSGAPSDASPAPAAPAASSDAPAPKTEESSAPAASASQTVSSSNNSQAYVTPIVRKLAADNGIDLASVKGSGIGGRIRKQDVQDAIDAKAKAEAPAPAAAPAAAAAPSKKEAPKVEVSPLRGTEEKMSRLRKIVASRMVESLQTQAQLTTAVEVDMTRIAALRARAKNDFLAREGAKLTFLPFIMQAAVEALKAHPKLNAEIAGDMIKYHGVENIGMAADTERGLVVPVIKNAGDLNLAGLARQIGELGAKAKGNKLTPDDLQGATFTITNTGSGGALFDTPIVPNPQVGILGCGTIVKRPAVVKDADGNETIGIRSMMYLFLSYDHRLVDGGDAARFLSTMKKRLEDGAFEGDLGL